MKISKELGIPIFTNDDVRTAIEKIGWKKYLEEIKKGFEHSALGKAEIPHKIYVYTPFNSDMRCMPAYLTEYYCGKYTGVKIVCVAPKNREKMLPTVIAEYSLRDAETMRLLTIMQAEELTACRTGAATAVATDVLTNKHVKTLCLIGAGKQAYYQAKGILIMRPFIDKIKIFDIQKTIAEHFKNYEKEFGVDIIVEKTIEHAIKDSDVVTTITPSIKPIIQSDFIVNGMHLNAVGADSKHKIEFDSSVLKKSIIFVDDLEQCINSGEIYSGLEQGIISKKSLILLGDVLIGKAKGRGSDGDITFFKSTGVAHDDLITAIVVYEQLKQEV